MQRRYLRAFGGQRAKAATDKDETLQDTDLPALPSADFAPRYHIDRFGAGDVAGWVSDPADPDRPLNVHFMVKGVLVGVALAEMVRADVANAGLGPKKCGFHWRIPADVAEAAIGSNEPIQVIAVSARGEQAHLARLRLRQEPTISDAAREVLLPALEAAIVKSSVAALKGTAAVERHEPATYPLHERMFSFEGAASGHVSHSLSPYPTFTHRRLHKGPTHPLDGSEAAKNAYLRWYIDEYGAARRAMRIPLGADEIAYLNQPVQMVGIPFKVSRVSLSYALGDKDAADFLPLDEIGRYEAFVAWWCRQKAPDLFVEDCLVPDYYVEVLRRMTPDWMGKTFAFSQMMMRAFADVGAEEALDVSQEADRILFHVWYLLDAIGEPGRVRFVPTRNLNALFDGVAGETQFDRVIQAVYDGGDQLGEIFNAQSYADLLWRSGFDLTRRRFVFRDAKGNRFEAARFPPAVAPPSERPALQVIGPFQKSSGLGQASRLSAEIIRHSGIEANFVDFGLDNPAPVGMTENPVANNEPIPARVNLIHLNGETVPIALAYMRDVFNGSYNIGYFFWELSTPALS
ncbi:MAG: hypothetical protein AAFW98_02450, partial [Pseudomonadota bacterium]